MSRFYKMGFVVTGYNKDKENDIIDAINLIWEIDRNNFYISRSNKEMVDNINKATGLDLSYTYLSAYGESFLYGGVSEQDFSEKASSVIWEANGSYCDVSIYAICLDKFPHNQYDFNHDKYLEMIKDKKNNNNDK